VPGGTAHWTFAGNTNYTSAGGDAAIAITLRPVTIAADAQTKLQGAVDPPLTYHITSGSLVGGAVFVGALTRARARLLEAIQSVRARSRSTATTR